MTSPICHTSLPHADILVAADTRHAHYVSNKEQFMQFNAPLFTPTYEHEFMAAIDAARMIDTDALERARQKKGTADVKNAQDACAEVVKRICYFAEQAFPDSDETQNQLGVGRFSAARKDVNSFVQFMEELARMVELYHDPLVAAGCAISDLDRVPALVTTLRAAKTEQQTIMAFRPVKTAARHEAIDGVWEYMTHISRAADHIYADDNPIKHLFALPVRLASGTPAEKPVAKNVELSSASAS